MSLNVDNKRTNPFVCSATILVAGVGLATIVAAACLPQPNPYIKRITHIGLQITASSLTIPLAWSIVELFRKNPSIVRTPTDWFASFQTPPKPGYQPKDAQDEWRHFRRELLCAPQMRNQLIPACLYGLTEEIEASKETVAAHWDSPDFEATWQLPTLRRALIADYLYAQLESKPECFCTDPIETTELVTTWNGTGTPAHYHRACLLATGIGHPAYPDPILARPIALQAVKTQRFITTQGT